MALDESEYVIDTVTEKFIVLGTVLVLVNYLVLVAKRKIFCCSRVVVVVAS